MPQALLVALRAALFLLPLLTLTSIAPLRAQGGQYGTVTGTVTRADDRSPLASVSVIIQSTSQTTVTGPVLDASGALVPGTGTNPRARYAVHFHETGTDAMTTPDPTRRLLPRSGAGTL